MTDNQIDDNEISSSENEGDEVDSDEEVYKLFLISREVMVLYNKSNKNIFGVFISKNCTTRGNEPWVILGSNIVVFSFRILYMGIFC